MNFNELPKLSPIEASELLKYFIETNIKLEEEGKPVNSISFLGHAGIAKTSTIKQVAEELGIDCQIIRLSNIDGAEELVGFPIKEHLMRRREDDGNLKHMWIKEKNYNHYKDEGWDDAGEMRTGYAPPAWLTRLETQPSLLLIDDYNRGSQRFMQALIK